MAEIKSTMDIIMEKAKEMTITDDDKKAFLEKEVKGRIKGLLQKYLDGILSLEHFKTEMASFADAQKPIARKELLGETLKSMTVQGDDQPFSDLLKQVLLYDIEPILDLLNRFKEKAAAERRKRRSDLAQALKMRGVSGSAVTPNLEGDRPWREYLVNMNTRFQESLKTLF